MKLAKLLDIFEQLAPLALAEPWDKAGLAVGDPSRPVRRGLLCIDLTDAVLAEALGGRSGGHRADLIVTYHPPIFEPLTALTTLEPKQRLILRAAERRVAIYSPHTALDAAAGGVNDWLVAGVGEGDVRAIRPAAQAQAAPVKLVVFVPPRHADAVRAAMWKAGAGCIGAYSECSFAAAGEGTFRGDATTHPAIGKPGRLERVPELRVEMICRPQCLAQVVTALRQAHPYEEPAFDIIPLQSPPPPPLSASASHQAVGQGRIVALHRPVTLATLLQRLKKHLGVRHLEVAEPVGRREGRGKGGSIQRVGLCAGAGASLLDDAIRTADIDFFITGEMRHHDVLAARQRGIGVILAGHTQTERPYLPVYRDRLRRAAPGVTWAVSRADVPPSNLR